jgi:hypothetical protein
MSSVELLCDVCNKPGAEIAKNIFKHGHTNFCPGDECYNKYINYLFQFVTLEKRILPAGTNNDDDATPYCFSSAALQNDKPLKCAQCGVTSDIVRRHNSMRVKYAHTDFCIGSECVQQYRDYLDTFLVLKAVFTKPAAFRIQL